MASDARSPSEVEVMEYTTAKAIYESLNKRYRKYHREMEKEVATINKSLDELENASDIEKVSSALSKVIETVCGAKRKADNIYAEERRLIQSCKRRMEHLNQLCLIDGKCFVRVPDSSPETNTNTNNTTPPSATTANNSTNTNNNSNNISNPKPDDSKIEVDDSTNLTNSVKPQRPNLSYSDYLICLSRFQRHLADYLFASGQPAAALKLARDKPELGDLCMTEIFEEAVTIENALARGDTGPAHTWLNETHFKLRKNENTNSNLSRCLQSYFEFDLRVFEFYLLVREGKRIEAVQHARKYMSSIKEPDDYRATKLGQAMILLAMRTPEELYSKAEQNNLTEKWIIKRAHEVLMDFYAYGQFTPFQLAVSAGITAIKTHYCYNPSTQHRDCAVCHPLINQLAVDLPFARHDHSVLTCFKTGLPMNEENPPMCLPNGYVYSQKGISELTNPDGNLVCPRSGETFEAGLAQRVFIV